jgi:hypothetical protein
MLRNVAQCSSRLLRTVMCSPLFSHGEGSTAVGMVHMALVRQILVSSRTLRTVAKERSLAVLAPDVAAQWHPTRNGDQLLAGVTSGTGAK